MDFNSGLVFGCECLSLAHAMIHVDDDGSCSGEMRLPGSVGRRTSVLGDDAILVLDCDWFLRLLRAVPGAGMPSRVRGPRNAEGVLGVAKCHSHAELRYEQVTYRSLIGHL